MSHKYARRINKELEALKKVKSSNFTITADPDDHEWSLTYYGPPNTPYEGGTFFVLVEFPDAYPLDRPYLTFLTRIYHPNITIDGEYPPCFANAINEWNASMKVDRVINEISKQLLEPLRMCCGNIAAKMIYYEDKEIFDAIAKDWTKKYAM